MYSYNLGYMLLILALIFAIYAQVKVNSTFNKYLRVRSYSGYTGAQVARMILDRNGLTNIRLERISGQLTDHYDPRSNIIRLSDDVYYGTSIAALSVAAHEVGHAIQHSEGYFPLTLRDSMVPIASIASRFVWIFILLGFIISPLLLEAGIILYLVIVLFQVITLPIEFNASNRALYQLESNGIIMHNERKPAEQVLGAAALTYVAATLVAIGQLIRLMLYSDRRR